MSSSASKITFKLYLNRRLKQVLYDGNKTYPLYIQIIYKRSPIYFKSYYFEAFSLITSEVTLDQIKKLELRVLEYLVSNLQAPKSVSEIKTGYKYYSADLCKITEPEYLGFLELFLRRNKLNTLSDILSTGSTANKLHLLTDELKVILKPSVYRELIDQAFSEQHASGIYLVLSDFVSYLKLGYRPLTAIDFEMDNIRSSFIAFVTATYPERNPNDMLMNVDKRLKKFRSSCSSVI